MLYIRSRVIVADSHRDDVRIDRRRAAV